MSSTDEAGLVPDAKPETDASQDVLAGRFDRIVRNVSFGLLAWCGANVLLPMPPSISSFFFPHDALWLIAAGAILVLSADLPVWALLPASGIAALCRARAVPVTLAAVMALTVLIGAKVVFHGYALSRDEVMAWFDATIFRSGHLIGEVPSNWRAYAAALEPRFMQDVAGHVAWVSFYLPVNALLRAALDVIPGFGLASPLLVAVSLCATFGVARILWPERRDAAVVATLLLATSPQMIVTAFTPYANTAHMAFNLVWLWLFLRNTSLSHAGAIAVGFLATGLHQLAFHPLFVGPFVLQLWLTRRWSTAAAYTVAYAAIGLFWVLYWRLMLAHYGLHGAVGGDHGIATFVAQVLDLFRDYDWDNIEVMGKNLTRFLAWQNAFALPLVVVAIFGLRRRDDPMAALLAGFVLTIAVLFVLVPSQGHGWGYRYIHGLLGSFCLLAAQGWIAATGTYDPAAQRRIWTQFGVACLFAIVFMLPGRLIEARHFMEPFISASKAIEAARTDVVVVDSPAAWFAEDLVRNEPDLHNHPLIFDLTNLDDARVRALCADHSVSIFGRHEAEAFHLPLTPTFQTTVRPVMKEIGCGVPLTMPP